MERTGTGNVGYLVLYLSQLSVTSASIIVCDWQLFIRYPNEYIVNLLIMGLSEEWSNNKHLSLLSVNFYYYLVVHLCLFPVKYDQDLFRLIL
jgi:hypothetical protein